MEGVYAERDTENREQREEAEGKGFEKKKRERKVMARFRERATAGESEGGERAEPRFSRFIPRIWIHSAGQPANRSGHPLMPGSLYASWPPTGFPHGRNTVASIDRSTKVARFLFQSARIAKDPRNNRRYAGHVSSRQAPLLAAGKGARPTFPFELIMQRNDV